MRTPDDFYAAPQASLGGLAGEPARWLPLRWIPAVSLGVFGVIFLVFGIGFGVSRFDYNRSTGSLSYAGWLPIQTAICVVLGLGLLGVLALTAARSWHACRWHRAVVLTVVILLAGAAFFFSYFVTIVACSLNTGFFRWVDSP